MVVSEKVSPQQAGLTGRQPRLSTEPGTPRRGGWIPILTLAKSGRPHITDWICPVCKRLTAGSRACPECGLGVMEKPTPRGLLTKERRYASYKRWSNKLFDSDEDKSLDRHPKRKHKHKSQI